MGSGFLVGTIVGEGRGGRVGVSFTLSTTGSLVAPRVATEDMLDEFSTV